MGKCLSRFRKLGKNADTREPAALRDSTEAPVAAQSIIAANEQMGITGSSPANRSQPASIPPKSSPFATTGRFHGAGEQSERVFLDKSVTPPIERASSSTERMSSEQIARDRRASEFFNRYRDHDVDCILADGIERLCADIGVAPDDFSILVLAWKFNAEMMCRFTREEFIGGCRALGGADSPESINVRLPDLVTEVVDSREKFRDLYRWTYRFGLDLGQRTLPLAMAISLWRLVFSQRPPPTLERWLAFLERRPCGSSGIMRDTWDMFLLFTEVIGNDFERYDESEAWPSLIDDFVEYECDRKNHNVVPTNVPAGDFCHD